jgi:hypothetical protein
MRHALAVLLVFLASASSAWAQAKKHKDADWNALTPTDVLEFGQLSATGTFQAALGSATFKNPSADLDIDLEEYRFQFNAAVGLGGAFEIEAAIPYVIKSLAEGDGTADIGFGPQPTEIEIEEAQFGDLTLMLNHAAIKEGDASPQLIFGIVVVAPVGWGRAADAEFTVGGAQVSNGETGGIGEGIWRYGAGAAISKRLGPLEPYAGGQYVLGGDRDRNHITYERPDYGLIFAGAEIHGGAEYTIDLRGTVILQGGSAEEDEFGNRETEQHHKVYQAQAQIYMHLGGPFTLVLGGNATLVEDHETETQTMTEIQDTFQYGGFIGLHVYLRPW